MSRNFFMMALLAAALWLAEDSARAQTRTAPTRVNTESIRTAGGGALFQAVQPRVQPTSYRGGFLHIYPGHNMANVGSEPGTEYTRVAQGQFVQDQTPESDLLPPLPGNQNPGEEVMGILDPSVDDPVFVDPQVAGAPQDVYYGGAPACGPCQNAKGGKYGKGGKGKGHVGFHNWNWACFCIPMPPEDNLSINFGVHGFKGPLNLALDGSFGYQSGVNLGAALPGCNLGIGWQIGLQGVYSNLPGQGFASERDRHQTFFTWGFFRRVDCGLQGGFVFDHMDDHFIRDVHLDQFRGEISWVTCNCNEFGLFFHLSDERAGGNDNLGAIEQAIGFDVTVEATDLVAFFYRRHFGACRESWGRIYIGATEERGSFAALLNQVNADPEIEGLNPSSALVLGTDMHVALSDCWALETGFTWLAADENDRVGAFEESWNVGFNVIWTPRGHCCGTNRGYYRPLFNVADNGTFLTHIGRAAVDD